MQKIAIIGAGLAGAALAERLVGAGKEVSVFEKSRGSGGRLASARLDTLSADLGAAAIDARGEAFVGWLKRQQQLGRLEQWQPRVRDFNDQPVATPAVWVGKGRNSSFTRELLSGATLITQTRIGVVWPDREGVLLRDEEGKNLGHFDAVICTAPAPQAVRLLEAVPRFASIADSAVTDPSWVYLAMLDHLPERLADVDIIEGGNEAIARIVVDSNKPGRSGTVLKVEMQRDWSEQYIDVPPETVTYELRMLLRSWLMEPKESFAPVQERLHRWLYNCSYQPSPSQLSLWDEDSRIGACGDWIAQSGLEGSFLSAQHLADQLLNSGQSAA